jgi:hypothetical protein
MRAGALTVVPPDDAPIRLPASTMRQRRTQEISAQAKLSETELSKHTVLVNLSPST